MKNDISFFYTKLSQEKLNYINGKKNLKELEFRNTIHIEYNVLQLFNYLFVHTFIKSTIGWCIGFLIMETTFLIMTDYPLIMTRTFLL